MAFFKTSFSYTLMVFRASNRNPTDIETSTLSYASTLTPSPGGISGTTYYFLLFIRCRVIQFSVIFLNDGSAVVNAEIQNN